MTVFRVSTFLRPACMFLGALLHDDISWWHRFVIARCLVALLTLFHQVRLLIILVILQFVLNTNLWNYLISKLIIAFHVKCLFIIVNRLILISIILFFSIFLNLTIMIIVGVWLMIFLVMIYDRILNFLLAILVIRIVMFVSLIRCLTHV